MGLRLFTAVVPPAELVDELDRFLEPRRVAEPTLRWTSPDTWHLTTAFMADVEPWRLEQLGEAFASAAERTPPFRLTLGGGGVFGPPDAAAILWLGVRSGAHELGELAVRCRNGAEHAGASTDGARFVPHLTLARMSRRHDARRLLQVLEVFEHPGWEVTELVCVESNLRDAGARHTVIERFPLGGLRDANDAGRQQDPGVPQDRGDRRDDRRTVRPDA